MEDRIWPDYRIYFPSRRKLAPYSIIPAILSFMFIIIGNRKNYFDNILEENIGFFIFVMILIIFSSIFTFGIIFRRPRIMLSKNGITKVLLFHRKFWRWSDVGRFSASSQSVSVNGIDINVYFICAFSDRNHDYISSKGVEPRPSGFGADIKIMTTEIAGPGGIETAEMIAEEANRWRERFGNPEIEVDENSSKEFRSLIRKEEIIKYISIFFIIIITIGQIYLIINK